jgi:hypothetical protein
MNRPPLPIIFTTSQLKQLANKWKDYSDERKARFLENRAAALVGIIRTYGLTCTDRSI